MSSEKIAQTLEEAHQRIRSARTDHDGDLRTGIDLGTATCVITVVDAAGRPVWIDFDRTAAIRDGVVVDFAAAAAAVRKLKATAEAELEIELVNAATAFPPCIGRPTAGPAGSSSRVQASTRSLWSTRSARPTRPSRSTTGWSSTSVAAQPGWGSSNPGN